MYFNYGTYVCGRMNQKAAAGGWLEDLDEVESPGRKTAVGNGGFTVA